MGVKIILAKKRNENVGILAIQHIKNKIKVQKRIGIQVKIEHFEKYFIKKLNRFNVNDELDYNSINNKISEELNKFNGLETSSFKNHNKEENNLSYIDYFKKETEKILVLGTKSRHLDVLKSISRYLKSKNKSDLLFREIDPDWIDLFVISLKNRGLANTSIVDTISTFRKILNSAINEDIYYYRKNPFCKYQQLQKSTKPIDPLSDEDISRLINLKSNGTKKQNNLMYFKNMFLFQFFANGMRMSDIFFIRWEDFKPDKLVYQMMKTDRNMEVYLNINICHIINEILGNNILYDEVVEKTKLRIPVNCYRILFKPGEAIEKINIIDCNVLLKKLNVKNKIISNETKGGDIGRFEFYKGYYYSLYSGGIDKIEAIKEIIDLRILIEDEIENNYIRKTYTNIRNLDKTEFVFEKFIKDKQKGIFKKYNKNKELTEIQYKRYKNLQVSYNYYLSQIKEVYEFDIRLSSHIARHSFINSLLKSGKADLWDIKNLMGHGELRTSEKYINKHFQGKEKQHKINKEVSRLYQIRRLK
ncbi:MAG: phage integrase SAM-like domain-containing protein [Flavobacterium sp.]